jgi:membrane-bound lytic murein transglycosylase D
MNPSAKSPIGAAGLFQFMAPTARRFGLKTRPVDERLAPEKSARAAAKYLKVLHWQFNSWPLVLAVYNAGEGRVGRLLKNSSEKTFEAIEESLPIETQMYVPKVMATVALREGVDPAKLPAPTTMNMPEGIFLTAWVFRYE